MDRPLEIDARLLEESAEDLYENAPCGYLSTDPHGLIVKVNATFLGWTGYERDQLVGKLRFQELLDAGGRIYHETHYVPLLQMQGAVREIALNIRRADGSAMPALVNADMRLDERRQPLAIRTTIFNASDRRRYEQELLSARRQERHIAEQLQRSLLSGTLPASDRFELGVEYHAAGAGLEVGGDWYDAFWIEGDGRLALCVGDVVGRGIGAAATMGQLRSAVRAIASTGAGPARLLEALERYAHRHEVGMSSTLVYAELTLDTLELKWACAGHLPPLLASRETGCGFLWDGRSEPLDVYVGEPPTRQRGSVRMEPGDLLMLYTDGLVERRDASLDAGMERLAGEVERHRGEPATAVAASTFAALDDEGHADDICLLALRLTV